MGNPNLKASLQDIRLYNVAFTDSEVANLYSAKDSESGAVAINMENIIPFNSGAAADIQPGFSVPVSAFLPSWSASGLPAGLSISSSTGKITGTATGSFADSGTDHAVDVMATNGYGKTTRSVTFKGYPLPSSITDGGATDLHVWSYTNRFFADATGTDCGVHFLSIRLTVVIVMFRHGLSIMFWKTSRPDLLVVF